jgi:selenocysteine lyase/cysteine desulfurase
LHALQSSGVEVEHVRCGANTIVDPADIRSAIRPNTKLIALVHASNVTGSVQPFEEVYEIARKHDVPVLLDAAQSLGHLPIEVAGRSGLLVAAPGHKALGGPLGVGILYASPDVPLAPTRQGGTGTKSQEPQQPDSWPDRFESGNHNVPAILGLAAGIRFADQHPHELQSLHAKLVAGLDTVAGISIYGSPDERVGVVSFNVAGWQAQEVAAMLDAAHAIEARAGYLCAPLVHPLLGSEAGGVVRLSLGRFNTADQVNLAVAALTEIAASSASF